MTGVVSQPQAEAQQKLSGCIWLETIGWGVLAMKVIKAGWVQWRILSVSQSHQNVIQHAVKFKKSKDPCTERALPFSMLPPDNVCPYSEHVTGLAGLVPSGFGSGVWTVESRVLEVTFHSGSDLSIDGEIALCSNPQLSPVKWKHDVENLVQGAPLVSGIQHIPR